MFGKNINKLLDKGRMISQNIAIIGGTGKEGRGLAYRLACAGHSVTIGSREISKAVSAAKEINNLERVKTLVKAELNPNAITANEISILTVPYQFHKTILEQYRVYLKGKILIDATVPIEPPRLTTISIPPLGSAALEAQYLLGESVTVVCAFQNIAYELLLKDENVDCDILVCCSKKDIRAQVIELIREMGLRARDAGPLENSIIPEGLTSILIGINKQYGIPHAPIRITGIPE